MDFCEYIERLNYVLQRTSIQKINQLIAAIKSVQDSGTKIFVCGNGGSAATASHFAEDLGVVVGKSSVAPIRALSLCSDVPLITCLGNDYTFEEVFVKQLQILHESGDMIIGISCSGTSSNILRAIQYANDEKMKSAVLIGFEGSVLNQIAHIPIHVPTLVGEYGITEDAHLLICHYIVERLKQNEN